MIADVLQRLAMSNNADVKPAANSLQARNPPMAPAPTMVIFIILPRKNWVNFPENLGTKHQRNAHASSAVACREMY
jgi:hypothetical protein